MKTFVCVIAALGLASIPAMALPDWVPPAERVLSITIDWEAVNTRSAAQLTLEQLAGLLRRGVPNEKPETWPARREEAFQGWITDLDRKKYQWEIRTGGALELRDEKGNSCLIELPPDPKRGATLLDPWKEGKREGDRASGSEFEDLTPEERPQGIRIISNYAGGAVSYMVELNRKPLDLLPFLERGLVLPKVNRFAGIHISPDNRLTALAPVSVRFRGVTYSYVPGDRISTETEPGNASSGGAFVDEKDRLFFWELLDDHLLWIEDSGGRAALYVHPDGFERP